jgi:N-methylhydantoinase B
VTDLISMQVIRYGLEQIADEMGYTLVRTGRSTIITEIKDISCVITDAKGQTIAQAHHTPSLLAGFEITMRELVKAYGPEDLEHGDVIVTNDPYRGCQHIMDLYAIAPVFHGSELIGFVGNITHHTDLGGVAAGGVAGGIREIYLEGLRLPMVKLVKRGVEDREIFGIIANQIRVPDKTLGDIRAQISSLMVGVDRLDRLFRKYGKTVVQTACVDLLDYSERRMRQGLQTIPSGIYCGEDFIDDDGINDRPIRVAVKLTINGGQAIVDLTESDPQAEGNTNSTIANTYAAAYYVMIAVVDPQMPPNSGCYRPIEVLTKSGTIVDPLPPGAVAARTNCSQKIVEALFRALASAVPDRVPAGGHAQITTCAFGGFEPETRQRFVFTDIQGGGNGGRPHADGSDGQDSHLPRFMNTPVEAIEQRFPIRIERYELVPDSGGAGKFRGSLALRRDIRVLTGPVSFARYADRHTIAPKGLFGGHAGTMGHFELNPETNHARPLRSKGLDTLQANDLVRLTLPGAGGYGDPKERSLDALDRDLMDGKVTPDAAETHYAVVVDRAVPRIERDATQRLRAKMAAASQFDIGGPKASPWIR